MYFENEIPPPTPSQALRAREALPPRRREGDFLKGRYTFDFLSNLCYNKNEKHFKNEIRGDRHNPSWFKMKNISNQIFSSSIIILYFSLILVRIFSHFFKSF